MKTNYLKNIFLVSSWMILATSTAIFATSQQGASIQANLVNLVQYLGELHITSDGTPNGDSVLSIDGNWEFAQSRSGSQLVNTASLWALWQSYPFVWAAASSGDMQVVAWVLAGMVPILANQNTAWSWMSSYIMAQQDRALLGFNSDLTNETDRVVELQVLDYGIVFRFPQWEYTFPLTAGSNGQVLTTDGSNELSWADVWGATESIVTEKISLTAQDILSLDTNSIELISAPGAGKFIRPIDVSIKYNFWSTPYQDNNYSWFYMCMTYPSVIVTAYYDCVVASNILTSPNSSLRTAYFNDNTEMFENQPLQINIADPDSNDPLAVDLIAGDGTIDIYISYKIVDL